MISVNKVRNLVMFLLEKENRGYIKPAAFDSYADLAQRDLFENLFYRYNKWVNNQNRRFSNTEYADIPKNIREQIDVFAEYTTEANFIYDSASNLWNYTGNDLYRTEGLSLVNAQGIKKDIEEVNKSELNNLIGSNMIAPTTTYPAYVKIGESYRIYPTVPDGFTAEMFYIRTPKAPKWTYTEVDGNPVYNAGATDLQNFELDEVMFPLVVQKILGYCGISLREDQIVAIANNEEMKEAQQQN